MPSIQNELPSPPSPDIPPDLKRKDTKMTADTQYIEMLLQLDSIHWSYNFLSSLASWVLLAGYLVVPGTFTSLQNTKSLEEGLGHSHSARAILNTVQNPPLVAIACTLLGIGAMIMMLLFYRWRDNYIWVTNRLFLPTCLNACAGLLTTLVNIYTAKDGDWSIMALLTVIATGLSAIASLGLSGFYKFWKLRIVRQEHERLTQIGWERVYP